MFVQNLMSINPIAVKTFHSKTKCQSLGGARVKVRGYPKSLGFIPWDT